ncbi:MAG TPA: energy transducer TonB, partial [Candidatus Caenarcaniphilales bacterium]
MSYTPVLEALPEPLRQPGRLAMLASVAAHGVLFAALPLLSLPSKPVNSQRVVDLVQLSTAEQNRLPQFATPQTQLPSLPPNLPPLGLPPLSGLPNYALEQPEAYSFKSPAPQAVPSPVKPEALGPIVIRAPVRSQPPQQINPFSKTQPLPDAASYGTTNSANLPPFPNKLPNLEPAVPAKEPFGLPPVPDVASASAPPTAPNPQPSLSPSSLPVNSAEAWLARAREISGDPKLSWQQQTISIPYPKAACKGRLAGSALVAALVAPDGKLVAANGTFNNLKLIDSTGYPTLNNAALSAESYSLPATGKYQAFAYRVPFAYSEKVCSEKPIPETVKQNSQESSAPSLPKKAENFNQLLADARQQYDPKLMLRPAKVPYVYPQEACKDQLEGLASVVALVKPDGNLAEKPQLVASTGHPLLDNTAVDTVTNHQFASTGQYQAFISSFGFTHSQQACSQKA